MQPSREGSYRLQEDRAAMTMTMEQEEQLKLKKQRHYFHIAVGAAVLFFILMLLFIILFATKSCKSKSRLNGAIAIFRKPALPCFSSWYLCRSIQGLFSASGRWSWRESKGQSFYSALSSMKKQSTRQPLNSRTLYLYVYIAGVFCRVSHDSPSPCWILCCKGAV